MRHTIFVFQAVVFLLAISLAGNFLLFKIKVANSSNVGWRKFVQGLKSTWTTIWRACLREITAALHWTGSILKRVFDILKYYFAQLNYRLALLGIGTYLLAVLAGVWLVLRFFLWMDNPLPGTMLGILPWLPFWAGLLILVGAGLVANSRRRAPLYWQLVWACWTLFVLYAIVHKLFTPQQYGDNGSLENFLNNGAPYPAWLIGNSILGGLFSGLWLYPPFVHFLPPDLQSAAGFVLCASAISMGLSSIILLKAWPNRLGVLFPMVTPFWLMFSTGYSEYYPFIVGPVVAILAVIFSKPLKERSPVMVGLLAALLALLYNGFIPLAVLLLLWYALARRRDIGKTIGICLAGGLGVLGVFWPGSISNYFTQLYANMNWGETNTFFPRYQGKSIGPNSIFFTTKYALSAEHLRDVTYFCFWGGVTIFLALLLVGLIGAGWKTIKEKKRPSWLNMRLGLALSIIAFLVYYIIFMIPKWGPPKDLDLFFLVHTALAFFGGGVWDWLLHDSPLRQSSNFILAAIALGANLALVIFLIKIGLPSI